MLAADVSQARRSFLKETTGELKSEDLASRGCKDLFQVVDNNFKEGEQKIWF